MKYFTPLHLKYGLIMLGLTAACLLLMEVTGKNESFGESPYTVIYTFIAPLFVWFFGLREYKKAYKQKLTWKTGVRESFKIALVYAITSPFLFLVYYPAIFPDFLLSIEKDT